MNRTIGGRRAGLILFAVVATEAALVLADVTVNIALPEIARSLRFSPGEESWIVNAYLVAFTGALLLGARLSDMFERRLLFQLGVGVFGAGALLAGLAPSQAVLLVGRAVQGVGSAIAAPAALAILATTFADGQPRNRALATWSAVGGATGAVGLIGAGALAQVSWRLDLLLNVVIALVLLVLGRQILPAERAPSRRRTFDLIGAVTATAGLALVVYAIAGAVSAGWGSAATLERGIAGLLLLGLFVAMEARTEEPLLPLRLFRRSAIRGGNVVNLFVSMSLYTVPTLNSLYLQKVLHIAPLRTGLYSMPQAGTIIIGAAVAARLTTRWGFKPTTLLSFLVGAVGLVWYSRIGPHGSFAADFLGPSLVVGLAIGAALASVSVAAFQGVPPRDHGIAAGLVSTSHNLGKSLGVAILLAIAAQVTAGHAGGHVAALAAGYRAAFLGAAGFGLAGCALTALLISSRASHEHAAAAQRLGPAVAT